MENARELLLMVDAVSKEKNLPRSEILEYIADGISTALRKSFPAGAIVHVEIDDKTGHIRGWRLFELVDSIEDVESQMLKNEVEDEVVENGYVWEPIQFNLGRQHFNIIKQVTLQKIRSGSKEHFVQEMLSKSNHLFTGTVKVLKKDHAIIDYLGVDFILPKRNMMIKDTLKIDQRVYFTLEKDRNQYVATRASKEFLYEIMKSEIMPIEEGHIEIVDCIRVPGIRSKVLVRSHNAKYDAVKTCIGAKGSKVKSIQNALNGEHIDIIQYTDNTAELLVKLIAPINVHKIIIDQDAKTMQITVAPNDLEMALGKNNRNIDNISKFLGYQVEVFSTSEWNSKEGLEKTAYVHYLSQGLSCDEELASYIYSAGFSSIEEIAYVTIDDELDELDNETIEALKENAKETLANKKLHVQLENNLSLMLLGFNLDEVALLEANEIKTKQDVADLSTYDLQDVLTDIDTEKAKAIIIQARHDLEVVDAA